MLQQSITRLAYLCEEIPPRLYALDEARFSTRPAPGKWSGKEIIGHLIDSATNNHQRFVRAQFEAAPHISYDPDAWNEHSYYRQMEAGQVIRFWAAYNKHLLELIQQIPEAMLNREVHTGGPRNETLAFLIEDYVVHMEHHLREVLEY